MPGELLSGELLSGRDRALGYGEHTKTGVLHHVAMCSWDMIVDAPSMKHPEV